MAVVAYQTLGDGPPLVLLHGVGLDRTLWARCVPRLARHYRVVVPDLPGHGRSARLPGPVTLATLAGAVADLLERPAHVAGFSLGALVAAELALARPERVSTLALISCVANRTAEQRSAVQARLALATADFARMVEEALERWFTPEWREREPDLVETVRRTMLANDREAYLDCYRLFAEADARLWPRLPDLRVPTLVVTGGEDPGSTPEMAAALRDAIPGAEAIVVVGARHLLPLERPDDLVTLLRAHLLRHDS